MIIGGVVSIYVTDMDRAIDFYARVLGLHLRTRIANDWAELVAGPGLTVGLHIARPPETVAAGTRGAIDVELQVDGPMEDTVRILAERAGKPIVGTINSYEHVRIAALSDPDGNVVLLAEQLG